MSSNKKSIRAGLKRVTATADAKAVEEKERKSKMRSALDAKSEQEDIRTFEDLVPNEWYLYHKTEKEKGKRSFGSSWVVQLSYFGDDESVCEDVGRYFAPSKLDMVKIAKCPQTHHCFIRTPGKKTYGKDKSYYPTEVEHVPKNGEYTEPEIEEADAEDIIKEEEALLKQKAEEAAAAAAAQAEKNTKKTKSTNSKTKTSSDDDNETDSEARSESQSEPQSDTPSGMVHYGVISGTAQELTELSRQKTKELELI